MKAILELSASGDGYVMANFSYEGGFDPKNAAHQHMLIINKVMDNLMERHPSGVPIEEEAIVDAIFATQNQKSGEIEKSTDEKSALLQ